MLGKLVGRRLVTLLFSAPVFLPLPSFAVDCERLDPKYQSTLKEEFQGKAKAAVKGFLGRLVEADADIDGQFRLFYSETGKEFGDKNYQAYIFGLMIFFRCEQLNESEYDDDRKSEEFYKLFDRLIIGPPEVDTEEIGGETVIPGVFRISFQDTISDIEAKATALGMSYQVTNRPDGKRWAVITLPTYLGLVVPGEADPFVAMFGFGEDGTLSQFELHNFQENTFDDWCAKSSGGDISSRFLYVIDRYRAYFDEVAGNPKQRITSDLNLERFLDIDDFYFEDSTGRELRVSCARLTSGGTDHHGEFIKASVFVDYPPIPGSRPF